MFGTLGGPELFLILVIALIVFGPRALPDIGKSIGKMLVEFRRASNDFKRTIEEEVEADKLKSSLEAGGERPPILAPPPAEPPAEARTAEPLAEAPAASPEPATGSVSREAGMSDGPKA
jgi:Tat protein translocase TatB subunit